MWYFILFYSIISSTFITLVFRLFLVFLYFSFFQCCKYFLFDHIWNNKELTLTTFLYFCSKYFSSGCFNCQFSFLQSFCVIRILFSWSFVFSWFSLLRLLLVSSVFWTSFNVFTFCTALYFFYYCDIRLIKNINVLTVVQLSSVVPKFSNSKTNNGKFQNCRLSLSFKRLLQILTIFSNE